MILADGNHGIQARAVGGNNMNHIEYDSLDYFENLVLQHRDIAEEIDKWINEHKKMADKEVVQKVLIRQIREIAS